MQVTGVVDSTYTKSIPIKRGPRAGQDGTVYHTVLDDGTDINCGWKDPGHEAGAFVRLEVENSNFGLKLKAPGNKSGGSAGASASRPANAPSPQAQNAGGPAFPIKKGTKDIAIVRQNSAQHASRIVAALINAGQLSSDDVEDTFFHYAYAITDFSTGHREENIAAAMAAVDDE